MSPFKETKFAMVSQRAPPKNIVVVTHRIDILNIIFNRNNNYFLLILIYRAHLQGGDERKVKNII